MGLIYLEQEKYNEAISEFQLVLSKKPENDMARYYLGVSYVNLKDHDNAIDNFLKVPSSSKSGTLDGLNILSAKDAKDAK